MTNLRKKLDEAHNKTDGVFCLNRDVKFFIVFNTQNFQADWPALELVETYYEC